MRERQDLERRDLADRRRQDAAEGVSLEAKAEQRRAVGKTSRERPLEEIPVEPQVEQLPQPPDVGGNRPPELVVGEVYHLEPR